MKGRVYIFWSIFIAAAILRLAQSHWQKPPDMAACLKHKVEGQGEIVEEPEHKESAQIIVVESQELRISGTQTLCNSPLRVRLRAKLYPRFVYGDGISFAGNLSRPYNFPSDSGRPFDYQGYLAKDDIYYEIKSAAVSVAGSQSPELSIGRSILYRLRRDFVQSLRRLLGEPQAALAAGLVVGEKAALGKDLLDDFRRAGLIHIVVLSGYNITIVAVALRRSLAFLPREWGISIAGAGIALFAVLVGAGATVVRSCLMAGTVLAADLVRRDYSVHRALVFAALIMIIENPMVLFHDPSFQLSFLATSGLIVLAGPIENRLTMITEKFGLRGIVASTLATQIFIAPYITYMMGQISIVGLLANILVLPLIPATMLFVFLAALLGMMPFLAVCAQVVAAIAHFLLSYELLIVENFARLPFASIQIRDFPLEYAAICYGAFFAVRLVMKKSDAIKRKLLRNCPQ